MREPRSLRPLLWSLVFAAAFAPGARAADFGANFVAFPPSKVTAGQVFSLPVGVQNTGTKIWARDDCAADTLFFVSYHWAVNGVSAGPNFEGQRTPIPKPMKPGDSAKLTLVVQAPLVPGDYTLVFDVVQEGFAWFSGLDLEAVTGGPWNVKVAAAPAAGSLSGISVWYPLGTPTSVQKVFVLREGNCPVDLDFGDGTKTTLPAADSGALHGFGKGKFTIKATGCGQTVTGSVEVADTACPFFVPAVKVCETIFDCCDIHPDLCAAVLGLLQGPPDIDSVEFGGELAPGRWVLLQGKNFAKGAGILGKADLLLKDPKGGEVVVPLEILGSPLTEWTDTFVHARVPSGLSGVTAQTGFFRITRPDGVVSNLAPVAFSPAIEFEVLPPALVSASCANEVACNRCNDQVNDCAFPSQPATSIEGWHQSVPAFSWFGVCLLGGGGGTDHYSANLANGWTLAQSFPRVTWGEGKITGTGGFAVGSSAISGSVSWSVDGCETVDYEVDLIIKGPRGVPFQ